MNKKLFSLLLVLVMVASVLLTSCSSLDEEFEEDVEIPEITLTLYGIKGEGTTDEAVSAVEAEINKYTKKNYKTTIDLNLFLEDEYDEKMSEVYDRLQYQAERDAKAEEATQAAAQAARDAAKKLSDNDYKEKKRAQRAYEKWAQENMIQEETSVEMEDDVALDIFLTRGFENYLTAINEETIVEISSYINGSYKLVNKFTNPIILGAAKIDGLHYGIPANKMLGTGDNVPYYYAVRTDLAKKYNVLFGEDETPKIDDFKNFFARVKANENCYVMLAAPTVIQNFDFFCQDMENYPAYGTRNNEGSTTTASDIEFTFEVGEGDTAGTAVGYYKKISNYRNEGYFAPDGATIENTDFAMAVLKGTLEDVKAQMGDKADQYSYCVYKSAKTTEEEVFENILTVSADCKYPDRAAQVIVGLHTVPELRNAITYGVENVNYTVNEDGKTIKMLNNDYNVDFELYGNSLIGYVPEELGADYQAKAAEYNLKVKVGAFFGYVPDLKENHQYALRMINSIAKEHINALIYGVPNVDEYLTAVRAEMGETENVLNLYPETVVPEGEEYVPGYNVLLEELVGDFAGAISNRPLDRPVPDNSFVSAEEQSRLNAIKNEKKTIAIEEAQKTIEEGQVLDIQSGDITIAATGEFIRNIYADLDSIVLE